MLRTHVDATSCAVIRASDATGGTAGANGAVEWTCTRVGWLELRARTDGAGDIVTIVDGNSVAEPSEDGPADTRVGARSGTIVRGAASWIVNSPLAEGRVACHVAATATLTEALQLVRPDRGPAADFAGRP